MSENRNQQDQQQGNTEQYIEQLTTLIAMAESELVPALKAALEALKNQSDDQSSGDDFKMSGYTAQDQLLKLAADVKNGHANLQQRKLAGAHLARLAGGRR